MTHIDNLLERARTLGGLRFRAVFPDGGEATVSPSEAVRLLLEGPVVRFEPLGDVRFQGHLPDLLNGLLGGDGNG